MINILLAKVIGTQNERELKKLRPIVARINELESSVRELSDTAIRERTAQGLVQNAGRDSRVLCVTSQNVPERGGE